MTNPGRVNERTSASYTAQLVDEDSVDLLLAAITTITLTLYDHATGTIINSRDAQDILNANNVTISSTGALVWTMQPADNTILNPSRQAELHVALFQGTYGSGGLLAFRHEYVISVANLTKVA